ncbi:hypothetical protein BKA70DRAFT_1423293 [Coprinopsis sp. MPI-PUGE-AT-0042]|nr:hypothetical protein BKA70DRAFT_1423293 [Coprinopsis sp. MPI-PUGE-AT-0042]
MLPTPINEGWASSDHSLHILSTALSPILSQPSQWHGSTRCLLVGGMLDSVKLGDSKLNTTTGHALQAISTVSFTFYGTGVEIFGSKRPSEYGSYQVTLDEETFEAENGTATTSDFRASLFSRTGLSKAEHTIRLENIEAKYRDIDYEQSVGQDNEACTIHTIQDSDPIFTYEPVEQWRTDPPFVHRCSGGSGHAKNHRGAEATRLRFRGQSLFLAIPPDREAVALYGPAGAEAADVYSVRVDNGTSQSFSATQFQGPRLRSKQLMYFGSNLGRGEHELVVRLESVPSLQQMLVIDYAEVFATPSIGGPGSSASVGLIAAVVATGSLAVLSLVFMAWVFTLIKKGKLRRISEQEQTQPKPSIVSTLFHSTDQTPDSIIPFFVSPSAGGIHQGSMPVSAGLPTGLSAALTSASGSSGPLNARVHPPIPKVGNEGQAASRETEESQVPPPLYSASADIR